MRLLVIGMDAAYYEAAKEALESAGFSLSDAGDAQHEWRGQLITEWIAATQDAGAPPA